LNTAHARTEAVLPLDYRKKQEKRKSLKNARCLYESKIEASVLSAGSQNDRQIRGGFRMALEVAPFSHLRSFVIMKRSAQMSGVGFLKIAFLYHSELS